MFDAHVTFRPRFFCRLRPMIGRAASTCQRGLRPAAAVAAIALAALGVGLHAQTPTPSQRLQHAIHLMETRGDYEAALRLFEDIASGADKSVAARSFLYVGLCQERLDRHKAQRTYWLLLQRFPDQKEAVAQARSRLLALGAATGARPTMVARRVWDGAEVDTQGAPSPDGRYLSQVDGETGDLALRDIATGETRRLTRKGSEAESPDYALGSVPSPDGRHVAYTWWTQGGFELRIVDTEGHGSRLLYRNPDGDYLHPAEWSRDGAEILALVSRKDGTHQIVLIDSATGSARLMKTLVERWPLRMSLSPDGRYIAYDFPPRDDFPERDIVLLGADASGEQPLVQHPANDLFPLWTPDGRSVLFLSDRTGSLALWLVPVSNGRPQGVPILVKQDMGRSFPLGLSRSGAYYYSAQTGLRDLYTAGLDPETGRLLVPPQPVAHSWVGSRDAADWSPDGRELVYASHRAPLPWHLGTRTLFVLDVESGKERQVLVDLGRLWRPRWSADGRFILARGHDRLAREGVYRIDPRSGAAEPLMQNAPGTYIQQPALSADGRRLFYRVNSETSDVFAIVERDVQKGEERELYRARLPSALFHLTLSPDGSSLAFERREPEASLLLVVPTTGAGEARELLRLEKPAAILTLAFTPDGRQLFFGKGSRDTSDGLVEVFRIPAEGGEAQPTELKVNGLEGLRFRSDGRRVAFTSGEYAEEVWVLENFLPLLPVARRVQ